MGMLVETIRYGTGSRTETARECLLPNGRTSLWVILNKDEFRSDRGTVPGTFLVGPNDRASVIEIEEDRVHLDVEFTAAGAAAFFPTALSELRGDVVGLRDLWGDGDELRERVLTAEDKVHVVEQMLSRHLTGEPDPAICRAADWIDRGRPLSTVIERLGLLPRTFRRRFVAQVGITPKRYARIRRLQRVVRGIDGCPRPEWALVAAQHGYSDQAHLIDEFRDLVDCTPGQYISRRIDGPNHLRLS
jgi:AraC-like DNA-binding protein